MLIADFVVCASLVAVDGDTIKCNGENMRLMGTGKPFVSGVDTPEIRGKCQAEKDLAQKAKRRTAELKKNQVCVWNTLGSDSPPAHVGRWCGFVFPAVEQWARF